VDWIFAVECSVLCLVGSLVYFLLGVCLEVWGVSVLCVDSVVFSWCLGRYTVIHAVGLQCVVEGWWLALSCVELVELQCANRLGGCVALVVLLAGVMLLCLRS